MCPWELPAQRLWLLRGLPRPANDWAATLGEPAADVLPNSMPRGARYVGQVEWAWSPMNMRIDAYYLSMCSRHRHWLLWVKAYDDNWSQWSQPYVAAHGPRAGLRGTDAARLLLLSLWRDEQAT